jgi:hypothetical protein
MFGLAFLGNALGALIGGILAWLSRSVVKRIAIVVAFTAIVGTLIATLISVLQNALQSVAAANQLPAWLEPMLAWLPSNTGTVLGLVVTCEAALWLYRMSYKLAAIRVGAV